MLSELNKKELHDSASQLLTLDQTSFDSLVLRLPEIMAISSKSEGRAIILGMADSTGASVEAIQDALTWISIIGSTSGELSGSELETTLMEISPDPSLTQGLIERANAILSSAGRFDSEIQRRRSEIAAVQGVLPYFDDIGATVELRGVLEKGKYLEHLSNPAIRMVSLMPVASIRFDFDSGAQRSAVFQIGKSDLRRLISSLQTLAVRMDEIELLAKRGNDDY